MFKKLETAKEYAEGEGEDYIMMLFGLLILLFFAYISKDKNFFGGKKYKDRKNTNI